jgi:ribonuclease P/MRP protein subunit RPP40
VPQGSVLGPILFLVFINDIETVCNGNFNLQLFADDAKLYSRINHQSNSLRLSLDNLCAWANQWQLTINISKCCVLHTAPKNYESRRNYFINGVLIPSRSSYVDLGVSINQDVSFDTRICNVVSKARQRSSILLRGFVSLRPDIVRAAFVTYVHPILECNSIVWNPCRKRLIYSIENFQRSFSKRLPSLSSYSYFERLAFLNQEPIELRRLRQRRGHGLGWVGRGG